MRSSVPLRIFLTALLIACLAVPNTAFAVSRADLKKHQEAAARARARARAEQKKAQELVDESKKLEDRIDALEKELAGLGDKVATATARRLVLDREMQQLRADIENKQAEIAQSTALYDERMLALNARADSVYRDGQWAWLEVLLSSKDVVDFLQRTEYVNLLIADDEAAATELDTERIRLETLSAELDRALETLSVKWGEARAQEQGLRSLESARDAKADAARWAKSQKASLLAETRKNIARLRALARAEEAESARIAKLLKNSGSHGSGAYAGTFAWPTPGYRRVTSPYGYRIHPILHVRKLHTGIDIGAPKGANIVAAGAGKVIFAGYNGGYGNFTMVDHGNGLVTCYAHQSKILVSKGQHVSKGAHIGEVGSTGLSTGPHLHFEVRVNGKPVNPMRYL